MRAFDVTFRYAFMPAVGLWALRMLVRELRWFWNDIWFTDAAGLDPRPRSAASADSLPSQTSAYRPEVGS